MVLKILRFTDSIHRFGQGAETISIFRRYVGVHLESSLVVSDYDLMNNVFTSRLPFQSCVFTSTSVLMTTNVGGHYGIFYKHSRNMIYLTSNLIP